MKRLILIACLQLFSMSLFAQHNCSNPLKIDICPTTFLQGQTNAGMLDDAPPVCNIVGEDLVYEINAPNGINKLWVSVINATGPMRVSVKTSTCTNTCAYQTAPAGNSTWSFNVASVSTYYLWIDAATTVTFDLSVAGDTGTVPLFIPVTKGNLRIDSSSCALPPFQSTKKYLQVAYNGVYKTNPMTLAPLGSPGTMCITLFFRNKTGIEGIKRFVFNFKTIGYSAVSPAPVTFPGFYNPGNWVGTYAAGNWTFLFADSAGLGKGDFTGTPDSCLRYSFCFTVTPLNNIPFNTNVTIWAYSDGFGAGFNGLLHLGCCPSLVPNCLGAPSGPGIGSSTAFGFSFNDPGFLPVELLTFNAQAINNHIDLNWETATESNNNYFTVEKSENGNSWEILKKIAGAGNSITNRFYNISDEHPYPGTSYYRLSQTDYNGVSNICATRSVVFSPAEQISIYPNPADHKIFIDSPDAGNLEYSLYDAMGKSMNVPVTTGTNKTTLNISGLESGIYLLLISSDNNIIRKEKIVIKN